MLPFSSPGRQSFSQQVHEFPHTFTTFHGGTFHDDAQSFSLYTIADDEVLLQTIHPANIACGFHASDFPVVNETVTLAKQHGVGAHPSLPDRQGLGAARLP
ncbi:LamB/YcsF family-domain-containing protein [Mycena leptocephala]|nr:LamB/YcsF family-domain-containing protein [Mycena leptocephala]